MMTNVGHARTAEMTGSPAPRGAKILVVDDNALNAKLLRMALEAEGYVVQVAADAVSARRLLTEQAPAVALLDVQLPDVDGLTLLRQVRADRTVPHFPVVVVSAFAASDDLDRAYAAGVEAFLAKPVNIRTLLRMVEGLAVRRVGRERA